LKAGFTIQSILALVVVAFLASCATIPDQKYLQKGSLSNIRSVLVVTSSEDLTMKRAQERGEMNAGQFAVGMLFGPLALLAYEPIDWAIKGAEDASQVRDVQSAEPKETIAQRLSGHFTKMLLEGNVFGSVQGIPADAAGAKTPEYLMHYDGLVKLRVKSVSLRRVNKTDLSLFVELSAEMVSLKNGKEDVLLWSRQEKIKSGEPHTLASYKKNGVPMLDECLKKLSRRLADDLIYSQ
jgi:hypothetical protein